MIELADTIDICNPNAVDIVGTGGDGSNLFNVSTASAFVAAAAGVTIAKHGNRGVSTSSGSSDVLSLAGVRLDINKTQTVKAINTLGIGFYLHPIITLQCVMLLVSADCSKFVRSSIF